MFCPKCGTENLNASRFCKKCGKPLPAASEIRQADLPQFAYTAPQTGTLLGQTLDGKYRIDAKLGSGGMGDVYRAVRLLIGDTVAIKTLHAHLATDTQATERFRREAVTATQLRHRNIVALYDVGISAADHTPYLLMELAEGFSLRQIIRHHRILPLDFVVTVTVQVCAALEEAHRHGIIHRDIKPENIIANQTATGWQVKVLDFGIAKLYNQADLDLTQDGNAMGTPQYMSPEQCLGETLDGRSDLYSVGILLYEMLTGVVPFKSPTASAVAVQQIQTPPIPPRSFKANVPQQIEEVILRSLDKRREMRPPTASHLSQELIQAATFVFKTGLASVSDEPLVMPDVKREFDAVGETENEQMPSSHTLSSEILVPDEFAEKIANEVQIDEPKFLDEVQIKEPQVAEIPEKIKPLGKSKKPKKTPELKPQETKSNGDNQFDKADLSQVFEDAEHLLDEILSDGKDKNTFSQEKSENHLQNIPPIPELPKKSAEIEDLPPNISIENQSENVLSDKTSDEKYEENLSVETDINPIPKPVFSHEIESKPDSKKYLIFGGIGVLILLIFSGFIGVWFLSNGQKPVVTANKSAPVAPPQIPPSGMVLVAGGSFTMGGDEQLFGSEKFTSPPHEVSVKPFFMDIYEVTCEDYKKFIDATGYAPPKNWNGKNYPSGEGKFPVTNVNWDAANAYAKWSGKRLPSEAEWEFAARSTDGRLYSWGNEWKDGMANADNVKKGMVEVGTYKGASPFGIYDLIGNAWEWTSTTLEPYPNGTLPKVRTDLEFKIIRGGTWESDSKTATATRRGFYGARNEKSYENTSFRCVKDVSGNQ